MDHLCVCEEEGNKAWYKKPGQFPGTLVKVALFIITACFYSYVCSSYVKDSASCKRVESHHWLAHS